ncbi:sugar phosphate isomerase/epimerase family protein [Streptomyces antarcticus]|uniref:sugar phosphate isomerase/epimerase family protein n=1 Tax=Streptomyces antarcticus TaxID=2996458 RepID=UPI00226ECD9E|nr:MULTISPECIES: sugar phosphate isomerase/epimerase family protein [unclassified Streptomyces]MCY0940955.1 sugar phosphate isomerase/epimerase [Streptomyces sp. H34-AA3]MCY0949494.1 sugar phosphate isomerase/epimerase [Streptomyces sp. H27-S2]MCZ4084680.1 sugar phosphate isomerase/epimerase [Streptomyces sp. H34-S5]
MSGDRATAPARFSLNQETIRQWSLPELVAGSAAAGVGAVGLWRDPVRLFGVRKAAKLLAGAGLRVSSLCRGGFFTAADPAGRAAALEDNRRAVEEAAELGAETLVLVSGGLPAGDRDLPGARIRIAEILGELAPWAGAHGVRLGLEPLHPMFASDRCVVSTLGQALDLAEQFPAEQVGVVADSYHLWWDERLPAELLRAGAGGRIASVQVADWVTPLPEGVLLGRGQLGDGSIDLRGFRELTDAAGYRGSVEVEIFHPGLWARDGAEVLREVIERYREHVG